MVPARVSTAATAHQDRTGICARNSELTGPSARTLRLDPGKALDHRDIAERVGGGLGKIGIVPLDRALHRVRCAQDQDGQRREGEDSDDQRQREPPIQEQRRRQQQRR